jgi:urease beta subunit
MIRPERMSRPMGTAIQAKPGTDMICGMIRSEGISRIVGMAMRNN